MRLGPQDPPSIRVQRRCAPPFAPAPGALRRQRMLGPDLRNRLVSVAATGDRVERRVARRAAGYFHGRTLHGEPPIAAAEARRTASPARLRQAGAWYRS